MFQIASGVEIPCPENIKEEFQIFDKYIQFNLSFEKLKPLIEEIIDQLPEPLFFILEIPLLQQEEFELRKESTCPFHKKGCYLGDQSINQIKDLFYKHGDLLLSDGISQFAIYSHTAKDGIYIQKYKIITIFSNSPAEYVEILRKYNLTQTDKLITAWDTFSCETPGNLHRIETNGIDIFDVYDELIKKGMFVVEIAED